MRHPPGTRLGRYQILAPLGAGGMGEVYRARDTKLGREVALKVLPDDVARDRSRLQRFEQEARIVAGLNHPNIVGLFDVGDGYLVTELVNGEPIQANVGLSRALDIAGQIAAGVAAAHEAGIVHRDLKPANILLRPDHQVKILDFGLAKSTSQSEAEGSETVTLQTKPGMVMGTAGYMSPEQVRGERVDARSDIFNIGLILFELLSGHKAFRGNTGVELMAAILNQEAANLPDSVPESVRRVVARCLQKRPENRFQSVSDLAFSLRECAAQSTSAPIVQSRRRAWKFAAGIIAAVGLSSVAGSYVWSRSTPRAESWIQTRMGGPEVAWRPRLSPDGHTLAMVTLVADQSQVAVMRPESGDWSVLTKEQNDGSTLQLSWSPDGSRIYYDRHKSLPAGIYSVPVIGGTPRLVLENAGHPEALPDGSLLAARFNAQGQFQACRYWPDTARSTIIPSG